MGTTKISHIPAKQAKQAQQAIPAERAHPGHADPAGEELAARLRIAVTRLNRRLRQESLAGVSPAQASALGAIRRLGSPTLGELAVVEQVQPPTMTRLVGTLEGGGLVRRVSDKGDGRVVRVQITAEGRRHLDHVRTLKTAFLARGLAALDDEQRALAADLTVLLERLVEAP